MDLIKTADFDYFTEQIKIKQYTEDIVTIKKAIIGSYINDIQDAIDLTNESIPLNITKITQDKYSFTRVIPNTLKFQNLEELHNFANLPGSLLHCVDDPVALPGTKLTHIFINIESMSDRYLVYNL